MRLLLMYMHYNEIRMKSKGDLFSFLAPESPVRTERVKLETKKVVFPYQKLNVLKFFDL